MRINRLRSLLLALMSFALVAGQSSADEWTDLLAGGNLDAWRGYNKQQVPSGWRLAGGVLTRVNDAGPLITRKQYDNFQWEFEWKISAGGNSGALYRVVEEQEPPYHTGPEYQVIDNAGSKLSPTANNAAGALYGLYPPAVDASKPAGEWNRAKIIANGSHVEHWLNGQKLLGCEIGSKDWRQRVSQTKFAAWPGFAKSPTGHLALQDHGNRVAYRNLRVRRLKAAPAAKQTFTRPSRLLLVTQSGGFRHPTVARKTPMDISHTERVMQELGISSGEFRVDCTQDVQSDFQPELIDHYDVVMFYTTGKMFDDKNRLPIPQATLDWFLNDWLRQPGHGFLGVHAAADTYEDYQPYWDMIGGSFNGHPWTADTRVAITVHDPDHPAMRPWPAEFKITDEIYQFKHWQPEKVRVLMSLDMAKTDLKKPYHVPVCWVKQYGGGRVMHMSLGHRQDVWDNQRYQASLLGGIRWLVGKEDANATPNPEISAREEAKARKAAEKN